MTVGVVGYGAIGRETARLFAGAGARVVALNRAGKPSKQGGFILSGTGDADGSIPNRYYSTEDTRSALDFFSACDVVISTLPETDQTRGFVDEEKLRAMKVSRCADPLLLVESSLSVDLPRLSRFH